MCKLRLKITGLPLAVLLTTFVFGVTVYTLIPKTTGVATDIPTAVAKQADDLHRLYEAAMLSEDNDLRTAVTDRLLCADYYDSIQRSRGLVDLNMECLKSDRHLALGMSAIRESHERWTRQNMAFIREISTRAKAHAYAREHLQLIE